MLSGFAARHPVILRNSLWLCSGAAVLVVVPQLLDRLPPVEDPEDAATAVARQLQVQRSLA